MRTRPARLRGLAAGALLALPIMLVLPANPASAGNQHGDDKDKAVIAQSAEAWGNNNLGQLGNGEGGVPGVFSSRLTAVTVAGPNGVRAVAAGRGHSLALLSNGTVKAWGDNFNGELGDGTSGANADHPTPGSVAGLAGVKAIAAGDGFSLALLADGTVKSWGRNDLGQLGDGTKVQRNKPVDVIGLTGVKVKAIAAGETFSLALLSNGTVKAWGYNNLGQLGDGTFDTRLQPVTVTGLTGIRVTAISAGQDHGLALVSGGGVKAWGANYAGQLGTGATSAPQHTPVDVVDLAGVHVKAVAAGAAFSLALLSRGTVKGWGNNEFGQLGDGTFISPRLRPVDTVGLTSVKTIAAGGSPGAPGAPAAADVGSPILEGDLLLAGHSLAISGNTIKAWGSNPSGQLGDGTRDNRNTPITVRTGLSNPRSVSAGYLHSLAS